jgi:hypothetical protein
MTPSKLHRAEPTIGKGVEVSVVKESFVSPEKVPTEGDSAREENVSL